MNGTLAATGVLAPTLTTKAQFKLGDSVYDNLPLTGEGTVQVAGTRILPSKAHLSVAGNDVDLNGSFGAPGDRLRFRVDAPALERLGFGLAGTGQGRRRPDRLVRASERRGELSGRWRRVRREPRSAMRKAARNCATARTARSSSRLKARDSSTEGVELATLDANLNGTRAHHTLDASATGKVRGQAVNLTLGGERQAHRRPRRPALGRHDHAAVEQGHAVGESGVAAVGELRAEPRRARRDAAVGGRRRAGSEVVRARRRPHPVGGHAARISPCRGCSKSARN